MPTLTTDYVANVRRKFDDIDKLRTTPGLVKEQALSALETAINTPGLNNSAKQPLQNKIQMLNNLSEDSMASSFRVIYSQMCVLAVSVVEAELKSYFINAFNNIGNIAQDNKRLTEVKISFKEILDNDLRFGGKLGALFLEKEKLNFQDLKSIISNFENYLGKNTDLDEVSKRNVCFYFEARHLLVHKGGKVDEKFVSATSVIDANIKSLNIGDEVVLEEEDWDRIRASFLELVTSITRQRET